MKLLSWMYIHKEFERCLVVDVLELASHHGHLSKKPSELSMSRSSEERFVHFASFSYFGGASKNITLCLKSERVKFLGFKCLGLGAPDCATVEERGVLVH